MAESARFADTISEVLLVNPLQSSLEVLFSLLGQQIKDEKDGPAALDALADTLLARRAGLAAELSRKPTVAGLPPHFAEGFATVHPTGSDSANGLSAGGTAPATGGPQPSPIEIDLMAARKDSLTQRSSSEPVPFEGVPVVDPALIPPPPNPPFPGSDVTLESVQPLDESYS